MDCVLGEDIMEWLTDQGDIDTILAAALEQYETTADVDVDAQATRIVVARPRYAHKVPTIITINHNT